MTEWETEQKPATTSAPPKPDTDDDERAEEPIGEQEEEGREAEEEGQEEARGRGIIADRALPLWPLIVAIILAVLCTYALLRIAGEQRYQSCLQALDTRSGGGTDPLSRLVRVQGVRRCSNSPF
jgi:hypothetical protein